jgi:hypothetical protein
MVIIMLIITDGNLHHNTSPPLQIQLVCNSWTNIHNTTPLPDKKLVLKLQGGGQG